jgi:hypothetical protein
MQRLRAADVSADADQIARGASASAAAPSRLPRLKRAHSQGCRLKWHQDAKVSEPEKKYNMIIHGNSKCSVYSSNSRRFST